MAESFGDMLRYLREAAGKSHRALAASTNYSPATIGHVETGRRPPSPELAAACDDAFGTAPLLTLLLELDRKGEDSMHRRAFLNIVRSATTVAGLSGATAVADLVRHGLLDGTGDPEDWDAVIADYARRLVVDPSESYGASLLTQLLIAKQQLGERGYTADRLRAVAELGQMYGLWLGNQGDIVAARGWYRSAAELAARSGDPATQAYVRARAASRGLYEGYTVNETVTDAETALALTRQPCLGTVEAQSALVHVYALAGDLGAGRRAVGGMRQAAEQMPETVDGPIRRTLLFHNYLECRIGGRRAADRAHAQAEPALRALPVWHADAKVSYGRALVADGDVADGVAYALAAVRRLTTGVRVVGLGVADLLTVVPSAYRSGELDELRTYAATGPAPWEALT